MGIELPAELTDAAAAAGVTWPEADEDRMREAAQAWREAAARMSALTGEADATASAALGTIEGATADAARAHWSGFVGADTGHLTMTARGCLAAADRLEHAADQVGAAKVEIVRNLVDLARNADAAAASGAPTALIGLDTAVAATKANVGAVTEALVGAVTPGGPDIGAVAPVASANPGARLPEAPGLLGSGGSGGLIGGLVGPNSAVGNVVGGVTDAVGGTVSGVTAAVGNAVGGTSGLVSAVGNAVGGTSGLVSAVGNAVGGPGGLTDAVGNAVRGPEGLTAAVGNAVGGNSGLVSAIGNAVGGPGGLTDAVGNAVGGPGGLTDAVGNAVGGNSGLVSAIGNAVGGPGGLTDAVGNAVGGVTDAVGNAAGGLTNGVGNAAGGLTNAVGNVAGGMTDAVGHAAGGGAPAGAVGGLVGAVEAGVADVGQAAVGAGQAVPGVDLGGAFPDMDLPTPPAGMPVADTVQAASAAVLDAPPAAAAQGAGLPVQPGQGAVPGQGIAPGQGGAVSGPPAGGGPIGGAAGGGGGSVVPGPRAQPGPGGPIRAELPPTDARSGDQRGGERGGDQRGGDQRAKASGGTPGAAPEPSTVDSTLAPVDNSEADTPASGFGMAVPIGGALLGGALGGGHGGGAPVGQGQPVGQAPNPQATSLTAQGRPGPGAGPVFGMPATPWQESPKSGLARLPGVFSGASIGDSVGRDSVALFLLHLFPIGYLPVAADEPHTQLPAPQAEVDYAAGLRFPPDDHPDAHLVDATTPMPFTRTEGVDADHLAEGYDPLGGLHERDWDRRFLVRPAEDGTQAEYAWPPGEQYPEGGAAEGEPDVLAPGTTLDRLGTPEGRVFAADETPFAARSLPPDHLTAGLRRYRVARPLPVWRAASAPWFAQRGGGPRLRATRSAVELVALGYLVEITEDGQ